MDTINVQRGDNATLRINFTDDNGDAIDLTGCTVYFTAKMNINDTDEDAFILKEVTMFTNPEDGLAIIELDSDDISEIGIYFYDIQLVETDGTVTSSGVGQFIVNRDITITVPTI